LNDKFLAKNGSKNIFWISVIHPFSGILTQKWSNNFWIIIVFGRLSFSWGLLKNSWPPPLPRHLNDYQSTMTFVPYLKASSIEWNLWFGVAKESFITHQMRMLAYQLKSKVEKDKYILIYGGYVKSYGIINIKRNNKCTYYTSGQNRKRLKSSPAFYVHSREQRKVLLFSNSHHGCN
jgi:hypothetical protein